ncbi:MAG: DUF4126 family protein [Gemmatimonadales bacterium]
MLLLLAFALGVLAGLRSMTPLAVVAWASRLGRLDLDPTPLAFLGSGVAAWFFAAAALGELVADKLPFTPNRTALGPFVARLLTGALSGGAVAAGAGGSLVEGAVAGAVGAVAGTFGGYRARTGLVRALGTPDWVVAVMEDVIAVGGAILLVAAAGRGVA